MSYLSKVRINPMRQKSREMLANPRVTHAMVQAGIATQPVTERTLWRMEATDLHNPSLLILTESRPDWTHVAEQAGWPHADGDHFLIRDYTPLIETIAIGREFAFKLTASPVQNTRTPDKLTPSQTARAVERAESGQRRGYRLGHRTSAAQTKWLVDRAPRNGFTIPTLHLDTGTPAPDMRIVHRGHRKFTKKEDQGERSVTFDTATFEGRLAITDRDLFCSAMLSGIGPAKSYGCGLLTLAPLNQGSRS